MRQLQHAQSLSGDSHLNLTKYEILALSAPISVSDGHPRQQPTAAQAAVLRRLTDLFLEATSGPFEELERRAQSAFLANLGQDTQAVTDGRVLSAYSSSVAMDVLARTLVREAPRVGLITPTFDNIPALLRRWGLSLVPLAEEALIAGEIPVPLDQLDAVFITTPNNPTGTYLGPEALRSIAEQCAEAGLVLAMDVCFRGFERPRIYPTMASGRMLEKTTPSHNGTTESGTREYSSSLSNKMASIELSISQNVEAWISRKSA